MLSYYLRLSWVSVKRNPILTSLIIIAIAIGVSMTMTAFTILYVMSSDPIPAKSRQLFAIQIDNGGPQSRQPGDREAMWRNKIGPLIVVIQMALTLTVRWLLRSVSCARS
jgi:hypothetical protein